MTQGGLQQHNAINSTFYWS